MIGRCALAGAAAAALAAAPAALRAQRPHRRRRVGVLAPSTAEREAATLKPFFDEMERLGWKEGDQVSYDRAFAGVVDRVLKGARPDGIPVEQPTRFELAFNSATARALGIEISQTVRLRADRFVE